MMLEDNDIKLRAIEPEDLDLIHSIENDTDMWEVSNTNVPYSKYAIKQFISNSTNDIYTDKQLRLVIEDKVSKKSIGLVDLIDYSPSNDRAEVGIVILKEHRKKGYGQKALNLLAEYAFNHIHINMLYAYVSACNENSISLFANSGYFRSTLLMNWTKTVYGFQDVYIYQKINDKTHTRKIDKQ